MKTEPSSSISILLTPGIGDDLVDDLAAGPDHVLDLCRIDLETIIRGAYFESSVRGCAIVSASLSMMK